MRLIMEKPTLPQGTRDFGPSVMAKRQFIFQHIRTVFQNYGFLPLETPSMENLSTLTGKYGDEGDQLLFRILNSGDFLNEKKNRNDPSPKLEQALLESRNSKKITPYIAEKGLRYDLTVPFARYVVMNRHEIAFPFKRFQIQPVWRGDSPQRGRYREFYQCDADVVGTKSLVCEAEIILMIKDTFKRLGIVDYTIKLNHRGVLSGLAEVIGAQGNETAMFVAIDKLDKNPEDKVKEELRAKGFTEESITTLFEVLHVKGSTTNKIAFLAARFDRNAHGMEGLRDIQEVLNLLKSYDADDAHVEFDTTLARGLSYYTGCIFEVKIHNVSIGSVSGGGRYDNLTAAFGDKENLPGVGFSFGVDRIYDAMEELKLFPANAQISSNVLVCHFDEESMQYGYGVLAKLRKAGIASEIYPEPVKIKKQLDYANKKGVLYTIVIGSNEISTGALALKDMAKGEQETLTIEDIIQKLH